jgi:hypothetical protein
MTAHTAPAAERYPAPDGAHLPIFDLATGQVVYQFAEASNTAPADWPEMRYRKIRGTWRVVQTDQFGLFA